MTKSKIASLASPVLTAGAVFYMTRELLPTLLFFIINFLTAPFLSMILTNVIFGVGNAFTMNSIVKPAITATIAFLIAGSQYRLQTAGIVGVVDFVASLVITHSSGRHVSAIS